MTLHVDRKAEDFVTTALQQAIRDAEDGGRALLRAVVEHVFHRAAQMDASTGMNNISELLDLATLAAEWGKHKSRIASTR
jgi:hypothetical protein